MLKDPMFWIGVSALFVAGYSAYFQRKQYHLMLASPGKRSASKPPLKPWWQFPPLIAAFALALLAWGPFLISWWDRPEIPTISVVGWGGELANNLPLTVAITKDDPSIRLMGVAYHYDGSTDIYDVNQLQKSALYDVRVGGALIMIKPDATFFDEVSSHKHIRTNYLLLSVPASLPKPDFSTLRQASSMGIKTIWGGVVPP